MKTGTGPGGRPGNMVRWNLLTAAGVALCIAGILRTKSGGGDMARWLALLGAVLFLLGMAGGSRCSAAHPPRCPVCGRAQRPQGRFFPGLGYNGTDTITCEHCGAVSPLAAWMKGRDGDVGPGCMEKEE